MTVGPTSAARGLARTLYAAAVRSADAGAATRAALDRWPTTRRPHWIIAMGKAAPAMGTAAVQALRSADVSIAGGLVVTVDGGARGHALLEHVVGDHPIAGNRSRDAADRVGALAARVRPDDALLVLVSGGASALVGAPVAGVSDDDLRALHLALLRSGADIGTTNAIRRRVARWGAGRLAAAVAPAPTRCIVASDVAGDEPAVVGSGPCAPDPLTAGELRDVVMRAGLADVLPPSVRAYLDDVVAGRRPETPKPADASLAAVDLRVVLSNADALRGAARAASSLGLRAEVVAGELAGPADEAGRACARQLLARAAAAAGAPIVLLWGGETTVALPADAPPGGRCQALALAAAEVLHDPGDGARGVALLAAGTDGRDGPTDAAGAIVDPGTWARIARAGGGPAALLRAHASHTALALAGDLLRARATGTNVRDVVVGVALR